MRKGSGVGIAILYLSRACVRVCVIALLTRINTFLKTGIEYLHIMHVHLQSQLTFSSNQRSISRLSAYYLKF